MSDLERASMPFYNNELSSVEMIQLCSGRPDASSAAARFWLSRNPRAALSFEQVRERMSKTLGRIEKEDADELEREVAR